MAGIDYYHCKKCSCKLIYIHTEEPEALADLYCGKCFEQLQAENKELLERIEMAADYLPECPDKAKGFLTPALQGGKEVRNE